jgi:predicted O-linked N-acetylglucosamine transferase (SPINDLY family)/predicted SAM-dependent methyltransferase
MGLLSRLIRRKAESETAPDREAIDAWVREGYDAQCHGDAARALQLFHRVLDNDPRHPDALFFLGSVATEDSRELEAVDFFERAAEERPGDAALHFVLAGRLFEQSRFDEAVRSFRAGVELHPRNVDMAASMWMAMMRGEQMEEARVAVESARDSGLESGQIDVNLAGIYRDHGRIDESLAAHRRALGRWPDDATNFSNFLFTLNYSDKHDAAALLAEHREYASRFGKPYIAPPPGRSWPRKLRIGYVSGDFRAHVVAFFIEPILEHHDRSRFEVYCYYNNRIDDHFTARFRSLADRWAECIHLSDAELADRIRADRIDILVDLSGHTAHNRLPVFGMKPAPVQATYLGYPNTTGLAAIDYRLTDARADPPGDADRQSAERLVRLPDCLHCYRPRPDSPDAGPLPAAGRGYVTFGCFNNLSKLSSQFLDTAAAVLAAVPRSRLWLKSKTLDTPYIVDRLRDKFVRAGIEPDRLEFSGWKRSLGDHLEAYREVDIALDSFPYNGTTTTCEALWMGVPVVAIAGDRHAARVGESLLHAVGLDDLISRDIGGYIKTCAELAVDRNRLGELRKTLRERVRRSPLCDERTFTRNLESCYVEMWQRSLKGGAAERELDPGAIDDAMQRAAQLRKAGKPAESGEAYEQILLARPDHVDALTGVWDLAWESGNPGAAVDWLNKAISARRDVAAFHYMLGCCLQAQGKVADALSSFSTTVEIDPAFAKAHNNRGWALEAAGDLDGALQCYQRAAELDPGLAVAMYNQGNVYRQAGAAVKAMECIREAVKRDPRHADWRCNLGDLLFERLHLDEALSTYRGALEIEPGYARAYSGLGLTLQALGLWQEAERHLRRALELDPGSTAMHSNLLLSLHYARGEERQALCAEHVAWARRHVRHIGWQSARSGEERRARRRRLRIGYVSPDFRWHPVAHFIEPVLAAHDKNAVHVFCYSGVARPDAVTRRIQGLCEDWREISRLTDEQVAERIRFDGIDILVDLAGHTAGGRLGVFARKPSPVQVTWLGYPNTTGLAAMDYRLTDAYADLPGESDAFHVEKLLRLECGFNCYQPPAESPRVEAPPSLKAGCITFGCFNNLWKITPQMVALWSRLLLGLPGATLKLKAYGLSAESARRELSARFAAHGIGPDRLSLLPPEESTALHLSRYNEVDVALDVFPYNGATTTCEALWMGVPVVTLAGKTHVSRVGMSILSRARLDDLVATSEEDYLAKAIAVAQDSTRRTELRREMRARLQGTPLLDAAGFTRALEAVYRDIWARYADDGRAPMRLHIGGKERRQGWKILSVEAGPHADFVGDCSDLSRFADGSVEEIYASHVIEHLGYQDKLPRALAEFHRVLKNGGMARISVPDFELLCRWFVDPGYDKPARLEIMKRAFGEQLDAHDYHCVGLSFEILGDFLRAAGFSRVEKSGDFGLFEDNSTQKFGDVPFSLNVVAWK